MNRLCITFALLASLSTGFVYPMQTAEQTSLAATLKNSTLARWLDRHKTPLIVGTAGLIAAKIAYSYFTTPTPDQIKEKIKQDTKDWLIHGAECSRDGMMMRYEKTATEPYYGYTILIDAIDNEQEIGAQALYTYACDGSQERVSFTFKRNQPRVRLLA